MKTKTTRRPRSKAAPLPAATTEAVERAQTNGHALGKWARRTNDPYGRWNAYCARCNRLAVVGETAAPNLGTVYGEALTQPCDAKP
jgi:hypothetical protein